MSTNVVRKTTPEETRTIIEVSNHVSRAMATYCTEHPGTPAALQIAGVALALADVCDYAGVGMDDAVRMLRSMPALLAKTARVPADGGGG